MRYAVCPNRKINFHCGGVYVAGKEVWNSHKKGMVKVPENNFEKCVNCDAVLLEAVSSCGCVNEHTEACKSYLGPD